MEELRPDVGCDDKLRNAKRIFSNRASVNPLLRDWIRSLQQVLDRLSLTRLYSLAACRSTRLSRLSAAALGLFLGRAELGCYRIGSPGCSEFCEPSKSLKVLRSFPAWNSRVTIVCAASGYPPGATLLTRIWALLACSKRP